MSFVLKCALSEINAAIFVLFEIAVVQCASASLSSICAIIFKMDYYCLIYSWTLYIFSSFFSFSHSCLLHFFLFLFFLLSLLLFLLILGIESRFRISILPTELHPWFLLLNNMQSVHFQPHTVFKVCFGKVDNS